MSPSFILDVLIAVMLIVTIGYSVVLYRRLGTLRRSQSDMKALVSQFSESIERAQTGLLTLKRAGAELSTVLDERTDAARAVSDDMGFLTTSAEQLADRLDVLLGEGRAHADAGALKRTSTSRPQDGQDHIRAVQDEAGWSETERELMEALREAK